MLKQATAQKVISSDTALSREALGEKAYKLRLLKSALSAAPREMISIPDFFVISSDGSGTLKPTPELAAAFEQLPKPVIMRSSHPREGNGASFSGVFLSVSGIHKYSFPDRDFSKWSDELEQFTVKPEFVLSDGVVPPEHRHVLASQFYFMLEPDTVGDGYQVMLEHSRKSTEKYCESHGLEPVDVNQLNVVVMPELKLDLFGMFLTTSDDSKTIKIYLEDRNFVSHPFAVNQYPNSQTILFDKTSGKIVNLLSISIPEKYDRTTFSKIIRRVAEASMLVEKQFGVQQIEVGVVGEQVYILQSRDFNIGKKSDIPSISPKHLKLQSAKSMSHGFETLPVLVIDDVKNTEFADQPDEMINYERYIHDFQNQHPDHILVLLDITKFTCISADNRADKFKRVNQLIAKARVVIGSNYGSGIKHEDWDVIEKGGMFITLSSKDDFARFSSQEYASTIFSGCRATVLSNHAGSFVWKENT